MPSLLRDLYLAVRSLRRTPGFTVLAAGSLALAIGANSLIFGVVNGLLFKPLPVSRPEQLVRLGATREGTGFGAFSYQEYLGLRRNTRTLEGLIAHQFNSVTVTVGTVPHTEWMELVSGNYFGVLGLSVTHGRAFLPSEDATPGTAPVVVISHALWNRRFGGRTDVVGQALRVNGKPFTVIGVAPAGFRGTFTGFGIDLWIPLMMQATALPGSGSLDQPSDRFLMLVGRLRSGATAASAATELDVVASGLASTDTASYRDYGIRVASASGVHPFIAGLVTAFLALMQGIVAMVLLSACANLANLLLVRAAGRRRELAVRAALGGRRLRLAWQLLAESLIVALLGGTVGLLLAGWLARVLSGIQLRVGIPVSLDFRLDWRMAAFTMAITLLTAIAAGFLPALRATRSERLADLRVGGATVSHDRARLRNSLVVVQIAVASLLLVNTDLLLQSLRHSQSADPGFDPANVMLLQAEPEQLGYDSTRSRALWEEMRLRALRIPGVETATLALFVPLGNRGDELRAIALGSSDTPVSQLYNIVASGYFHAMRIPLMGGRDFSPADVRGTPDVAILSTSGARRFFQEPRPLGKRLRVVDRAGRDRPVEVVGVVEDIKFRSLGHADQSLVYLPSGQWFRSDMVLHVRAGSGVAALAVPLTQMARGLEPDLAVTLQPMTEATAFTLIPAQIAGRVIGFAGLIGLLLALIGVFGVAAYAVAQRTRELGIRLALGGSRHQVLRLVVGQGLRPALLGIAVGVFGALLASRLLAGMLVDVAVLNVEAVLAVPLLLGGVSLLAAWLPARRVTSVNPAAVLREE